MGTNQTKINRILQWSTFTLIKVVLLKIIINISQTFDLNLSDYLLKII